MSNIQIRLARSIIPAISIHRTSRCFSTTSFCVNKAKPELLSDDRLQELVSELERPLNLKAISIDDTRDNLLASIESYRPEKLVVPESDKEKLIGSMSRSFTVNQLTAYVRAHNIPGKGVKKQQLMERIIAQHWGIRTTEQVKQEQLEKRRNRVSETIPASVQELFFVIGENGKTMKEIEDTYGVNITVDVEKEVYVMEGGPGSVSRAKKELQSRLKLIEDEVDLPEKAKENIQLQSEIDVSLIDISKLAGSFVSLKDNKIQISSLSNERVEDAKRLLSMLLTELDVTDKKPLDKADQVYVQSLSEYTALPLYHSKAMPFYNRNATWNRLKYDDKTEENAYRLLNGRDHITFDQLSEDLLQPFKDVESTDANNVSLEARFGYLLFQNNQEKNYYRVNSNDLIDLYTKNRTSFFSANPPSQITSGFIPLTLENGFHERSVKLEYIDKSFISGGSGEKPEVERIEVEFTLNNEDIELKNAIGEKNRRTIDVLGVHSQIDIRLIAKNYMNYNNKLGELIEKCKLLSYNDLEAPKTYKNLILSDITFINKKKYLFDNNLISLNHSEQQDKKTKRTELIINSIHPKAMQSWPSFSSLLRKVANQWDYMPHSKYT